ncbi:MAG: hypothetical protein ACYTFA_01375 [Planctomycetota bacterium]|jgi:hypothetical protein
MTTNIPHQEWQNTSGPGTRVCFDQISEPGCYICNWSGHLMRVPPDGIAPGRSPLLNMVGCQPLYVTKVCDNPYITVTKARMLAADYDLSVNF